MFYSWLCFQGEKPHRILQDVIHRKQHVPMLEELIAHNLWGTEIPGSGNWEMAWSEKNFFFSFSASYRASPWITDLQPYSFFVFLLITHGSKFTHRPSRSFAWCRECVQGILKTLTPVVLVYAPAVGWDHSYSEPPTSSKCSQKCQSAST